ncbi:MAG: hypothetical protein KG029_12430 [Bacteroidetes bacterium]|jgi:hypothetical protein|nr:hypothetical protein [Bacteroidota bacterium]
MSYTEIEKDLNSKILKVTMTIREQYPELSEFLEEMPVTIPKEENPEINLEILKNYYQSLSLMLYKYKVEPLKALNKT